MENKTFPANRTIVLLSVLVVVLVFCTALSGLFYSSGGSPRFVQTIYGERTQLFGDGIYENDAMLKATTAKGTDLVVPFVALGLLLTALKRQSGPKIALIHGCFLLSLFYYAANLAFGLAYNRLFLLYLLLFSVSFFALVLTLRDLHIRIRPTNPGKSNKGAAVFIMLAGCTAMVWMMDILPALFTGRPPDILATYTTEPTFVLDIGLIFPSSIIAGALLLKKQAAGYILTPVLLGFLVVIAVTVLGQTAMQLQYGVLLSFQQVIGYVVTFVVFGAVAAVVGTRFLLRCW